MHLYQKINKINKGFIATIAVFIVIVLLFLFYLNKAAQIVKDEEVDLLYSAINKAVVNCYAIEGRYPESLKYIVDNYGVIINEDKFLVDYQVFATNVKPGIQIIVKGEKSDE